MNAQALLDAFLANRQSRALSPRTISWYRFTLSSLFETAQGVPSRPEPIEAWLATSPSRAYANSRLTAVRAFYRWAHHRGHCDSNPTEELRTQPSRSLPRVFTADELRAIVRHAQDDQRLYAAVLTFIDTGVRVGELVSLRTRSLEAGHIVVDGKSGQHRVPVSPEVMAALMRLAPLDPAGAVFRNRNGQPMRAKWMAVRLHCLFFRAGLTGPKLGPHTLRHSFATHFLRQGGSIAHLQQILGHSSVKVTERYLHLAADDVAQEHARVSPLRQLLSPAGPMLLEKTG